MHLWRISNYADLKGLGGLRFSARWHTRGHAIIYTAEHPAGALSEMLVHMNRAVFPDTFQLLKIKIPDDVPLPSAKLSKSGWQTDSALSRRVGDSWLKRRKSLLLRVPSVIVPETFNVLINPAHPDMSNVRIVSAQSIPLDPRFNA
jgi:RES domain-containing protein